MAEEDDFSHADGYVYLDHAGSTLYSKSQLTACMKDLGSSLLANPHSRGGCLSEETERRVRNVRQRILNHFDTNSTEYAVVFTSGTTGSLRLIGDIFPWSAGSSRFLYHEQSHTSVLGIREIAARNGCEFSAFQTDQLCVGLNDIPTNRAHGQRDLIAFPGECNFSGQKLNLEWIKQVKKCHPNSFVLIDAAKLVGTSPLSLKIHQPDFVTLSFYKMFGYPTGIGALLVKLSACKSLVKHYFGGGTVNAVSAHSNFRVLRQGLLNSTQNDMSKSELVETEMPNANEIQAVLEDGTIAFTSVLSLHHGFDALDKVGGMKVIQHHTHELVQRFYSRAIHTKHKSGCPVFEIYGMDSNTTTETHGSIVAFNLLRDGMNDSKQYIGYAEVNQVLSLNDIQVRVGCFCNPGACSKFLGIDEQRLRANLAAGHVCWDDSDLLDGLPTGCIRVSFGYMTKLQDIDALFDVIHTHFVTGLANKVLRGVGIESTSESESVVSDLSCISISPKKHNQEIVAIQLYPIKSCRPLRVKEWNVSSNGLAFDRRWAIVNNRRELLNQKTCPKLCFIQPELDLKSNTLTLHWTGPSIGVGSQSVTVQITHMNHNAVSESFKLATSNGVKVFTGFRETSLQVAEFLSKHLDEIECTLVSSATQNNQQPENGISSSFVNQGDMLIVTTSSIDAAYSAMSSQVPHMHPTKATTIPTKDEFVESLRPNIILLGRGAVAFEEDFWESVQIPKESGDAVLRISSACSRCRMININQETGESTNAPLRSLAKLRRFRSRILFGCYASLKATGKSKDVCQVTLKLGTVVEPKEKKNTVE